MKKIDTYLFAQCENFKISTSYQKITDFTGTIDEEKKPIFSVLGAITMVLIPLFITLFFVFQNFTTSSNIEINDNIQTTNDEFLKLKNNTEKLYQSNVASSKINSQQDFLSQIRSLAGTITPDKINLNDFNLTETDGGLSKVQAEISFNNISNSAFGLFIQNLKIQKKIIFLETKIKRESNLDLISGSFFILQYSK
jgi:hypothetical protein